MKLPKEQTLVHVKIEFEEAVQAKKDLLSSQSGFIMILKTLKRYCLLRKEEINRRLKMQNKIKDLKMNMTRLNNSMPKVKIPEIMKNIHEKPGEKPRDLLKEKRDQDLEAQLMDIQERLRKLG